MRGLCNFPRQLTVDYKYESLEGVRVVRQTFSGFYQVENFKYGVKIGEVTHPYSVFNEKIAPYLVWIELSTTPTLTLVSQT